MTNYIGSQPTSVPLTSSDITDGIITTAKIADDAVTGAKIENNPTIAGNLSVGGTASVTGVLTTTAVPNVTLESDSFRITSNITASVGSNHINANWERVDGANSNGNDGMPTGTGLTESSGIFSFGKTGVYLIQGYISGQVGVSNNTYIGIQFFTTVDNSTYIVSSATYTNNYHGGTNTYHTASASLTFDVTDTSTHKFKMHYESAQGNGTLFGSTSQNATHFHVIRIGNT